MDFHSGTFVEDRIPDALSYASTGMIEGSENVLVFSGSFIRAYSEVAMYLGCRHRRSKLASVGKQFCSKVMFLA